MKALTIRQPWASLVAAGVKTIETRSQRTHHRGPLAIHAGLHRPVEGEDVGDWWWAWDVDEGVIVRQSEWGQHPAPLGAIVALVDVVDSVPITASAENGKRTIARIDAPLPGGGTCRQLWDDDGRGCVNITDQLPYGDFTPGRWGHVYAEVRPLPEPVGQL